MINMFCDSLVSLFSIFAQCVPFRQEFKILTENLEYRAVQHFNYHFYWYIKISKYLFDILLYITFTSFDQPYNICLLFSERLFPDKQVMSHSPYLLLQ